MLILIIVVMTSLAISGLCSLGEATLFSTRNATLEAARADQRLARRAGLLQQMKAQIAVPTSAILILNTVANTAGATLAGMYAARVLGRSWVPAFSIGLTLAILLLSEILPKTLGASSWKRLWPKIVYPLLYTRYVLAPAIWLTRHFASLFAPKQSTTGITEAEVMAMIRLGASSGALTPRERRLLNAVFRFDELACRHVMVPREEIVFFDESATFDRCLELARASRHTRYPVCRGSLDNIVGLLHIKDLIGMSDEEDIPLSDFLRPISRVPSTLPTSLLLRRMQLTRTHMAAVTEGGRTVGIITLEGLLEQLVGLLPDEHESERPDIARERDGTFIVLGHVTAGELQSELGAALPAQRDEPLSLVLGRIAQRPLSVGERIDVDSVQIEVLQLRGDRPAAVRIKLRPKPRSRLTTGPGA